MAICKYRTKTGEVHYKANLIRQKMFVKSKSFRRKLDAVQWLREQEVLISRNDGDLPAKNSNITLDQFVTEIRK